MTNPETARERAEVVAELVVVQQPFRIGARAGVGEKALEMREVLRQAPVPTPAGEERAVVLHVSAQALLDVGDHDARHAARREHAADLREQQARLPGMERVLEQVRHEHVPRAAIG
ncbi:MAG TPA: hypothetical protein VFX89_20175 [Gammaproteobacteria bacterium]|nr:hypothetical protein [Gammaproteobacteria bacterium]